MVAVKYKHPDEVLDYVFDWSEWLAEVGDTLAEAAWAVPDGLTLESSERSSVSATAWISGGTDGASYVVRNAVTTADGRTATRAVLMVVTAAK